MAAELQINRRTLEMATAFKYLGRVLTASDENWMAVVANIWKARSRRARLSRILGREGADPPTPGTFYKALVQATLMFGSETWVLTPRIGRAFGGFHHRVARQLAGTKLPRDMMG